METDLVTAVLPARNCRQALRRCLRALAAGDSSPKIIVVDDGSEDGTEEMVRRRWPSATLLRLGTHTGYAHAANAGLRLVRTKYAFLIRPDLQPGRSCVKRLLEAMEGGVTGAKEPLEAMEGSGTALNGHDGFDGACFDRFGTAAGGRPVFCAVPCPVGQKEGGAGDPRETIEGDCPADRAAGKEGGVGDPRETIKGDCPADRAAGKEGGAGGPREILAAPDGCAMYRMSALEEIGWLDERHFDGLEAFDLSLRAALHGYRTVRVPGSHVRGEAFRKDLFHRQLAAGNGLFVFYKNLPGVLRILSAPLSAAACAAQLSSFIRRGEAVAWRMAVVRGKALCSLERERRGALEEGVPVWAETLSDASFLGMEGEARQYPLFLAEKEPAAPGRLKMYLHIQGLLARELPGILRLLA